MLEEGKHYLGESGTLYLAVGALGQANVWTAVNAEKPDEIFVIKEPAADDPPPWQSFQHEMIMHELFKEYPSIRKQVDRIAPTSTSDPAKLVLEIFETTVWQARTKRPFTAAELKAVAKSALVGLRDVHAKGLVYADLKMQNIMLNGFNVNEPASPDNLITKLGDLGIVMYPSKGKVQPVSYRAPEIYFKGEITQAADIWSWALIYCHLREAQLRFDKTGLYDDLYSGTGTMPEREQAVRFAIANDYDIHKVPYYKECALPIRDRDHSLGSQWEELRKRGITEGDVEFLQWILKPDPRDRPTAQEILDRGWLDREDESEVNTQPSTNEIVPKETLERKNHTQDVAEQKFGSNGDAVAVEPSTEEAASEHNIYGLAPADFPPIVREMSQSPVKEDQAAGVSNDETVALQPTDLINGTRAMDDIADTQAGHTDEKADEAPPHSTVSEAARTDTATVEALPSAEVKAQPEADSAEKESRDALPVIEDSLVAEEEALPEESKMELDSSVAQSSTEKRKRQASEGGTYLSYQ